MRKGRALRAEKPQPGEVSAKVMGTLTYTFELD
jgi:hypothetical protein